MELKILHLIKVFLILFNSFVKVSGALNKENVLIIIVDDMRPLLPEWGDRTAHTPHINQLARKSVVFKNAFAQQALCAPSRNSLLTGRRPDSLRLYDFYSYWRDDIGNFTTLPQYFKENGYDTYSLGKVFHPGKSSNFTDDYPYSWSSIPYHPPTDIYKDTNVCVDKITGKFAKNLVCPVEVKEQPDKSLPDLQTVKTAIQLLKNRSNHRPFFLAVGLHKPHIPLKFPRKYLDLYPLENISIAEEPNRPYDMPLAAWNPWTDLRKRDDIKHLNISFPFGRIPDEWARLIKQSYYACLSYIDSLIGDLLKAVDEDDTIIVLTSDHGWSLGENGLWAKYSNFDVALKVPLLIRAPDLKSRIINQPVELIDLMPTLSELAQLTSDFPTCSFNHKELLCSEGKSLLPIMGRKALKTLPTDVFPVVAFSQYPRPSVYPKWNSDKPHLKNIKIMGYSVRSIRFRYTEWIEFDVLNFRRNWDVIYGIELYDHLIDKRETINLAARKGHQSVLAMFAFILRQQFK